MRGWTLFAMRVSCGFIRRRSCASGLGGSLIFTRRFCPRFAALKPQARALEEGVRIAGATVHFVSEEMDEGPIIAQGAVPVLPGDDEEALSARILAMEHRLYPLALKLIASGAAWLSRRPRRFAGAANPSLWPQT